MLVLALVFALALLPTASSLLVVAHTQGYGVVAGVMTALGIACADLLLVSVAWLGWLTWLELLQRYSAGLQVVLAGYFCYLGVRLWPGTGASRAQVAVGERSGVASFLLGLGITLLDYKALLFYFAILPQLGVLQPLSAGVAIAGCVLLAKLAYVFVAYALPAGLAMTHGRGFSRLIALGLLGLGGWNLYLAFRGLEL